MNILNKTTALVGIPFLVLFSALFTSLFVFQGSDGNGNKKIKISPEININDDVVKCLEEENVLNAQIKKPAANEQFTEDQEIKFEGSVDFKCNDLLKKEGVEQTYKYEWFLNAEGQSFSEELSGILGKKPEGSYIIRFKVTLNLEGLEDLKKEAEVKFKVVPEVTEGQTTTPPKTSNPPPVTPPPAPPPNQAPNSQIIRPKTGSTFTASTYNAKTGLYYVSVGLAGAGTDPEDGTLSGSSLKWYYQKAGSGKTYIGAGANSSVNLSAPVCGSTAYTLYLDAIDSKGAVDESSVNITVYGFCLF